MPIYEFECATCKALYVRHQTGYEPIAPRCEKCGPWMKLRITPASIAYKGDGWAKKERREEKR